MEEKFRYLFQRYLDNTCSRRELEEFFDYIHRSEDDEQLRQLINQTYLELNGSTPTHVDKNGRLVLNEPEWPAAEATPAADIPAIKPRKKWLKPVSIAATIIIIGIIWTSIDRKPEKQAENTTLSSLTKKSTDRAESKFIMLEDGTRVWLNAASSLEFPDKFDNTRREVYLTGEAYFDVKHADKIPFVIHTGKISTTVLGTAFNIKAYPGQKNITISVSRGKVKVNNDNGWTTTLEKGQQVKIETQGKEVKEKNIPAADVAAWQQGNIVFDDQTFEDIITDMQRTYNADVRIADKTLRQLKISTSFKREIGIASALQVLCNLMDRKLRYEEGIYFIE